MKRADIEKQLKNIKYTNEEIAELERWAYWDKLESMLFDDEKIGYIGSTTIFSDSTACNILWSPYLAITNKRFIIFDKKLFLLITEIPMKKIISLDFSGEKIINIKYPEYEKSVSVSRKKASYVKSFLYDYM